MRFEISCTGGGEPDLDVEVIKRKVMQWEEYPNTSQHYDMYRARLTGALWNNKGTLHQKTDTGIKRLVLAREEVEYFIEVNTLSELLEIERQVGRIIIDGNTIEVYDDYRE